jgi:hypothetical protein
VSSQKLAASANLRQFGTFGNTYGAENRDRIPTFGFEPGKLPQHSAQNRNLALQVVALDPKSVDGWTTAAAIQQIMIFRDLYPRSDWPDAPIANHIPHILYSHLIQNAYSNTPLPAEYVISPRDTVRVQWQDDVDEFLDSYIGSGGGGYQPAPPAPGNGRFRWAFSSSFQIVHAALSNDIGFQGGASVALGPRPYSVPAKSTATTYDQVGIRAGLGTRKFADVRSPGSKVYMHENYDRYSSNIPIYLAYNEARVPKLFFDGAVSSQATGEANIGWRPNAPVQGNPNPESNDPADGDYGLPYVFNDDPIFDNGVTPRGTAAGFYFRFDQTRWGLQGVDYGGAPVIDFERAQAFIDRNR